MGQGSLLTAEDIGKELDCNEVSALRLIARGQLKAGRIPPDKWRVTPDDFFSYVRAGVKDYRDLRKTPDLLGTNAMQFKASELEKLVARTAEGQRLSDQQIELRGRAQAGAATPQPAAGPGGALYAELQVTLILTPAIEVVLDGPIVSLFNAPRQTWPVDKFGDLYLAEKLREQFELQHRDAKAKQGDGLLWLYGRGPEAYTEIVKEGIRQIRAGAITFDEKRRFPDRGEGEISVHVIYTLSNALWATAARLQTVAQLYL